MSNTKLTYHLVIGTYRRIAAIVPGHERELYKYLNDFMTSRKIFVRRIGGMPDHVHILCDIPPTIAVASLMQILKSESSKFMKINPHFPDWTGWAERYGAFTVDASLREIRRKYIMNQREHHSGISFADEFRKLMVEAGFDSGITLLGD